MERPTLGRKNHATQLDFVTLSGNEKIGLHLQDFSQNLRAIHATIGRMFSMRTVTITFTDLKVAPQSRVNSTPTAKTIFKHGIY